MDDVVLIETDETRLFVDNDIPELEVAPEPNSVELNEMESAYRYELWRCLLLLQEIKTKVDTLEDALETITQQEVHAMWD